MKLFPGSGPPLNLSRIIPGSLVPGKGPGGPHRFILSSLLATRETDRLFDARPGRNLPVAWNARFVRNSGDGGSRAASLAKDVLDSLQVLCSRLSEASAGSFGFSPERVSGLGQVLDRAGHPPFPEAFLNMFQNINQLKVWGPRGEPISRYRQPPPSGTLAGILPRGPQF